MHAIKYMQLRDQVELAPRVVKDIKLPSQRKASLMKPPVIPVDMNPVWKPDRKFQEINTGLLDKEFPQYCAFVRAIICLWNCLFCCCGNRDESAEIITSALREGTKVADVMDEAKEAAPENLQYKYAMIQGRELFLEGKFVEAIDAFDEVPEDKRTPEFYLFLGQAQLKAGFLFEAAKAFRNTRTVSVQVDEKVINAVCESEKEIRDRLQEKLNTPGDINNLEIETLLRSKGEDAVVNDASAYGRLKLALYYADISDCMRSYDHFMAVKKELRLSADQEQIYKNVVAQRLEILRSMLQNTSW